MGVGSSVLSGWLILDLYKCLQSLKSRSIVGQQYTQVLVL
jgi:hypothetical protein